MDETQPPMLDICSDLFENFHEQDIKYCHWKSNEHLREGLSGITDLDIIVQAREEVERILSQQGFKRFSPAWFVSYPGLEDYFGFDRRTGELVHLHLHYALAIGNKRLKDYHLPWKDIMFSRRVFDKDCGVYRADPEMELCLLLIRYALKLQARDYPKALVGNYLDSDVSREYDWLLERVEKAEVIRLTSELLNSDAADVVASMLESNPGIREFHKLRRICTDELSPYNTYGYFEAKIRGFLREGFLGLRSLNERFLGRPRLYRRTVPKGGVTIVLLGVDGAGKSTIIEELDEWLSWKVDVQQIYYGSGDGPATLLRYPLIMTRRRVDGSRADGGSSTSGSADRPLLLRVGRVIRGLVLARERRKKLKKGWRANNRGFVVLGDRYPQNQIMGYTDGPLLNHLTDSSSRLLRYLAGREQRVYQLAEENLPDLVIKLDVSPEAAKERKPEMPIEQFETRHAAIEDLSFDTDVAIVDTEKPLEEVILQVKQLVWERL